MSRINILDSSVFNRIAAGEVVERPCSIVKELVENSIDAEADIISIEIKDGGLTFIRITDNGCGIDRDDLEKAFVAHATSKIKSVDDLNAIMTLGFRGEALTSIASVAKVTMISKTADSEIGNYIVIENGVIIEKGERGCPNGTTVVVENLFKNVPARAKFLSKPSTEESVINDMVSRLIMTNFTKSIKYTVDGKQVYLSAGDNLKNAVYAVYGKEFTENLVPISCTTSDITLTGYVCKPYFTKPNRTYQTLVVNGRYVVNADVSYRVFYCYQDYLMKRQFPVFILHVQVPPDMVDVNVHPNKLEIKFADSAAIQKAIYNTVKNKLKELTCVPKEIALIQEQEKHTATTIVKTEFTSSAQRNAESEIAAADNERDITKTDLGSFFTLKSSYLADNPYTAGARIASPNPSIFFENDSFNSRQPNDSQLSFAFESNPDVSVNTAKNDQSGTVYQTAQLMPFQKFKTCLFDTYIVLEEGETLFLIDQHAAHERILYDKLVKQHTYRNVTSQNMLVPYIFRVTPIENELLKDRLDEINACGFSLSALSDMSYSLSAVPLLCASMKVDYFITLILNGLKNQKYKKLEFINDILMQSACKAAVKGEDKLDSAEIDYLLKQLEANNEVLMCPHGRPLMIKITKAEIEKWFKRTV